MIEPKDLEIKTLPWLPINKHTVFPRQSGIYFAINNNQKILYIGQSKNIKERWHNHPLLKKLKNLGCNKVVFLFVKNLDELCNYEAKMISFFNPVLNKSKPKTTKSSNTKKPKGICVRQIIVRELRAEGLGKKIRQGRIAIKHQKSVEQICNEVGVSRTYWYDIENECIKGALSYSNLRRIEAALHIDLGIRLSDFTIIS